MERFPTPDMVSKAANCPLCRNPAIFFSTATDIEYFTMPDRRFDIFHCAGCDVLFVSPMLVDELDVIYPTNYSAYDDAAIKTFAVHIKEWFDGLMLRRILRSIDGSSIRVLDIGGGTGWLASLVRQLDPRVTATQIVDLDVKAKERAEENGHRYFHGRIEDFDTDEKFDFVLMLNLIEHVPAPDQVLRRVAGMLSPNGRILIKTPNFRSLDAVLFKHKSWAGYHCPRHFVLFSRESVMRSLTQAGLAVEHFSYTQGAPFWSISIMDLLRRGGWISYSGEKDNTVNHHPLLPFVQVMTAAFDFVRRPFSRLSQMIIVARLGGSVGT